METFWELLIASSASQRWSGVNFSVCFAAVSFALSRITNTELPHNYDNLCWGVSANNNNYSNCIIT